MKNVSSLKSTKTESPKTPGGISKSLLTPCRRVGLSRNWKKAGPSPFISPLSGSSPSIADVKIDRKDPKKRKLRADSDEKVALEEDKGISNDVVPDVDVKNVPEAKPRTDDISSTPTRNIELPRKKSKTLLSVLNSATNTKDKDPVLPEINNSESVLIKSNSKENLIVHNLAEEIEIVSAPVKKSKSKSKKTNSPKKALESTTDLDKCDNIEIEKKNVEKQEKSKENLDTGMSKPRSPNELTKECIVVIQKKIFKTDKKASKKIKEKGLKSQILFDSDSEDVPLCQLNKEKAVAVQSTEKKEIVSSNLNTNEDEDDFLETKRSKIKKLEDKSTSIGGLKKVPKMTINKMKKSTVVAPAPKPNADSSFDEEDDFDFTNKKTILIRKAYEKVNMPQKAKSTGSITQKDIDDIKARIEAKKKQLLACAMTEDTEELRTLIKKWKRGCQDALMELMDLMKNKFPDKKNMEYSEMLSMLKIPPHLVGYDDENDCFLTPDDKNLILPNYN